MRADPAHRLRRLLRGGDEQGQVPREDSFPAHSHAGQRHGGTDISILPTTTEELAAVAPSPCSTHCLCYLCCFGSCGGGDR